MCSGSGHFLRVCVLVATVCAKLSGSGAQRTHLNLGVSVEAVGALITRPPVRDSRGRTLLTTLTMHYEGGPTAQCPGRHVLFVPWYNGDSAATAALNFCGVAIPGLPLLTIISMPDCLRMVESSLIDRT